MATQESVRVSKRKPIDRVACRAFLNADQADMNGDEWNKVNFNETTYDLGDNFDTTTNYRFDVPVTGLYGISARVALVGASVVTDLRYLVGLYINGSQISISNEHASYAGSLTLKHYDELYLEKDDYIEIKVYPNVGGATDTVDIDGDSDGIYTYATIRLITREGVRS